MATNAFSTFISNREGSIIDTATISRQILQVAKFGNCNVIIPADLAVDRLTNPLIRDSTIPAQFYDCLRSLECC